jgi:predicted RND superfamily exporter protein
MSKPVNASPNEVSLARGFASRLALRYVALAMARPWTLALLGLALLAGSAPLAVRLYTDLRTDLRELLPRDAPAALAITSLEKRVGGFGHLSIVVETKNLKAGERFVDALTAALEKKLPSTMAGEIRSRTDEDRSYLEAHGALYATLEDLTDLDLGIKADVEKAKVKALDQDLDEEAIKPDPRVERVAKKLKAKEAEEDHFIDGYLAGDSGRTLVVVVTPASGSTSLDSNLKLYRSVAEEVKGLDPTSFDPSIRVGYDGEVREVIEAQEHLVRDLELSSVLVLGAVGA